MILSITFPVYLHLASARRLDPGVAGRPVKLLKISECNRLTRTTFVPERGGDKGQIFVILFIYLSTEFVSVVAFEGHPTSAHFRTYTFT